jgi:methylated-DNA-[protein]-cysteine S-methyltransferase
MGPFGQLVVTEDAGRITRLTWSNAGATDRSEVLDRAVAQLGAYFAGRLTEFDLPLDPGTGAQARFSEALLAIPFGDTRTYGELGKALGLPAQAIGQHCGANPIPVIIPCHRVLGSNGLGGFSAPGGVETKVALLKHEGAAGLLI